MKHLFSAILMVFATGLFAQEVENAVPHFRNVFWGVPKDSVYIDGKKVEFLRDKNALTPNTFYISNDDMTLGNVRLTRINYFFNEENRFFKVLLEGPKEDAAQMAFILQYKFGPHKSESRVDEVNYKQWKIKDVTFTLGEYDHVKFELKIESSWQATEAYKKNTTVEDF